VKRRLFNLLTLLSLGLCVLFVAAWLQAWWQMRQILNRFSGPGVIVHVHDSYSGGLPVPLLIGVTAVLPCCWLLLFRRSLRARRSRAGLCRTCRYDLTGNASGVCPECGTSLALVHEPQRP
jgi:hypothetical protein